MPVNKIRRNGSYAPLSAHYYKDDAIADAGEGAELLYIRGLAFCADVVEDGFISETQLQRFVGVGMRDAGKRAARLVEVGLWLKEAGGYRVKAWLKWNRSKQDIVELQRKDTGRKVSKPNEEPPEPPDEDEESERNPNGIQSESTRNGADRPNGVQTDSTLARGLHSHSHSQIEKSAGADAPGAAAPTVNAGSIVGAWVEAMTANGVKPTAGMRGQVGKLATELLNAGNDPAKVLAAAQAAGTKGFATVDRELGALSGRRGKPPLDKDDWRRYSEQ